MAPDLNSLPASPLTHIESSPSASGQGHTVHFRSDEPRHRVELHTGAHQGSEGRHVGPENGDSVRTSDRGRRLSLGQLHQEIENEQEAQVNRLLRMIRLEQEQLAMLSTSAGRKQEESTEFRQEEAYDAHSHRSRSSSMTEPVLRAERLSSRRSESQPDGYPIPPTLAIPVDTSHSAGIRHEMTFVEAETQNLSRENQMLRLRIQELERQLAEPTSPVSESINLPPAMVSPTGAHIASQAKE